MTSLGRKEELLSLSKEGVAAYKVLAFYKYVLAPPLLTVLAKPKEKGKALD